MTSHLRLDGGDPTREVSVGPVDMVEDNLSGITELAADPINVRMKTLADSLKVRQRAWCGRVGIVWRSSFVILVPGHDLGCGPNAT
jgi:hypothetical protein